jgi:hypothetical protein
LDQWTDLLKSLSILSPLEATWRFRSLVEKGLRKRHNEEPEDLRDRDFLRTALKTLGAELFTLKILNLMISLIK